METIFKNISKIKYEGPKSKNPLAFKHYNPAELVEGKALRDHLRFSVVYWHTFRGVGSDPFGVGTAIRKDGRLAEFVKQRYASWDSGVGAKIEAGRADLTGLESYMLKPGETAPNVSGRQEFLENLINEFI